MWRAMFRRRLQTFGTWWHARSDAKYGIPKSGELSHYEQEWIADGNRRLQKIARQWDELDKKLKAQYCQAKKAVARSKTVLKRERKDVKELLEELKGRPREPEVKRSISHRLYVFVLVAIALAEIPLTVIVFRLAGESELLTYVMASALCAVMPFSGHLLGLIASKHPFKNRNAAEQYQLIGGLAAVVAVLIGIAFFRAVNYSSSGIEASFGVEMSPLAYALVFLAINFLLFFIGFVASYQNHNIPPEVLTAVHKYKQDMEMIAKETSEEKAAEQAHNAADDWLVKIRNIRENSFAEHQRECEQWKFSHEGYIQQYRKHNSRYRIRYDKGPVDFAAIQFMHPESLLVLDDRCQDDEKPRAKDPVENTTNV